MQPRKERTVFELQTSLKDYKKRKVEDDKIPFNLDPNFSYTDLATGVKGNQVDQQMAPTPMTKEQKKK